LLREYYEATKPHLDKEDIEILMEDFSYDEEIDDERDIRKAKIALKEEVAKAKSYLDSLKKQYYEEIKAGSRLNPEQQKAVEFFNRYNKEKRNILSS
jgi:GTP1/Obg family GTP-binding protein